VWVLQPGGKLDLALEALRTEGAGQLWVEDLERHEALVPNVAGKLTAKRRRWKTY
jgi:hypothetical protein